MRKSILILLASFLSFGCLREVEKPPMTQLEIRERQTRLFEEADQKSILKEMINVLQDDGYIVKNANLDLGILSAEKDVNIENFAERFFARSFSSHDAPRWKKHSIIEVSAHISQFGKQMRVRANFQVKTFDNMGILMEVHPILDSKFYQEFFQKVDKGLFIQKEKL